jgi:2-dehydro-3-deoxygalactonokinase
MTGEFYALLRTHSILARTLPAEDGELDEAAFVQGVRHAIGAGSLLHGAFSARTMSLFDRLAEAAAPSFLSGLLIGEELRAASLDGPVVLVGADKLTARYALALDHLGLPHRTLGPEATWRGLHAISQELKP